MLGWFRAAAFCASCMKRVVGLGSSKKQPAELWCHLEVQRCISCAINFTHTTRAQQRSTLVGVELRSRGQCHEMVKIIPPKSRMPLEDTDDADFGSEVFGIGGDGEQGLRASGEQQVVEQTWSSCGTVKTT
jgi:hypothetical protein